MNKKQLETISGAIRNVPDFPRKGVQFKDISTLVSYPVAFDYAVESIGENAQTMIYNKIAAAESRGFIFGSVLAFNTNKPMVMVRKKGKLPGETVSQEYQLEYGTDTIEVTKNSFHAGERVLVVDDLIATGGTILAICDLIEKCGATVAGVVSLIDLPDLGGSEKISKRYTVKSTISYIGE